MWLLWRRGGKSKRPRGGSVGSETELDAAPADGAAEGATSPARRAAEKSQRGWFSFGSKKAKMGGGAADSNAAAEPAEEVAEATPLAAAVDRPAVPEQWAAVVPASGEEEQQQLEKALHMSRVQSEGRLNGLTVVSRVASGAVLMDVGERADSTTVVEGAHEEGDEELQAGRWHEIELHDEARATVVPASVQFGTLDQRSAGGPGACSVLAVRVAAWLTARAGVVPAGGDLDNLMHEGVAAWKALCGHEGNRARFPDLHLDLETALAAQTAVRVCRERSFVGFLQPKGLEPGHCPVLDCLLEGVMPLDAIWAELAAVGPAVFLVSWNDHFFTLQTLAEEGGCLLIDSLGERLHVGCKRAYLLHFAGGAGEGLRACAAYLTAVVPEVALQSLADDVAADARLLKDGKTSRLDPLNLLRPLQIEFQFVHAAPATGRAGGLPPLDPRA